MISYLEDGPIPMENKSKVETTACFVSSSGWASLRLDSSGATGLGTGVVNDGSMWRAEVEKNELWTALVRVNIGAGVETDDPWRHAKDVPASAR